MFKIFKLNNYSGFLLFFQYFFNKFIKMKFEELKIILKRLIQRICKKTFKKIFIALNTINYCCWKYIWYSMVA